MSSIGEAGGGRWRQRGFALLLVLLVLTVGGTSVFLAARSGAHSDRAEAGAQRARTLGKARSVVIASALMATSGDASEPRPGALTCPDQDVSGDGGSEGAACRGSLARLGRVPHRTFDAAPGMANVWYAIAGGFLNDGLRVINPDAGAGLTLDGRDHYAAVLVEPGPPIDAGQADREQDSENPDDFLEGVNADDTSAAFIDCADSDDCNDRARGITIDQLFERVQYRVLDAVAASLEDFYCDSASSPDDRFLPRPAELGDNQCVAGHPDEAGGLPTETGDCEPESDPRDTYVVLPSWVTDNKWPAAEEGPDEASDWPGLLVYRVAAECTRGGGDCSDADLAVNGEGGFAAVVAAAGRTRDEQDRSGTPALSDYLDDPANHDPADTAVYRDFSLPRDNDAFLGVSPSCD